MGGQHDRERRLTFGEVAAAYHRVRPAYPAPLIRDVVEWTGAPGGTALEIGAGTGKATLAIAEAGFSVVALEPDGEMADVLEHAVRAQRHVAVIRTEFEKYEAPPEPFDLVFSAQAWHWLAPGVRARRARSLLAPAGALAIFWNFAVPGPACVRDAIVAAYEAVADGARISMPGAVDLAPAWVGSATQELETTEGFGPVVVRKYEWEEHLRTDDYITLLDTYADHRVLEPELRRRLFERVKRAVDGVGGEVTMETTSRSILTRRDGGA